MNVAQSAFYIAIGAASVAFVIVGISAARRNRAGAEVRMPDQVIRRPTVVELIIGAVVAFFDTLGIGSFAPTTAIFKLLHIVPDELIPGTLNVGLNVAALLESLIFVTAIVVEPVLLITIVLSAAVGAWLGAGIVARLPRRAIQVTMGIALLIAAYIVKGLSLSKLRWLVIVVIIYAAFAMLRSAARSGALGSAARSGVR